MDASLPKTAGLSPKSTQRGIATVEFALVIVPLLLVIFGIFEMSLFLYTYNVVADSAKEGVRAAIVLGSDSTNSTSSSGSNPCSSTTLSTVYTTVCSFAAESFHNISGMTVTVSYPDTGNTPPNRVQVTVSYPYKPLLGLGWPSVTINAASEGRVMF
jgi:Flp pilus assembly protein TadG